jgi:hypothetical protein
VIGMVFSIDRHKCRPPIRGTNGIKQSKNFFEAERMIFKNHATEAVKLQLYEGGTAHVHLLCF